MTRRDFLGTAAATAAAAALPRVSRADGGRRPNVLVLMSDDQAFPFHGFMRDPALWPGGLGCDFANRFPFPRTPFMDALAANGIAFHEGHVEISDCAKSRQSTWTGRKRRDLVNVHHATLAAPTTNVDSIPIALARAGYMTCGVGKCQIGGHTWEAMGTENVRIGQLVGDGRDSIASANACDLAFLERLLIDARAQDRPWMFAYCPLVPHQPFYYPGHGIPVAPDFPGEYAYPDIDEAVFDEPYGPGQAVNDVTMMHYIASSQWFSKAAERVFDMLAAHGYLENTLVCFTSDHGASIAYSKGPMTEAALRQPLIVYYKAGPDSAVASIAPTGLHPGLAGSIDFFPTICEATGATPLVPLNDAKSLLALAQDPSSVPLHRTSFVSDRGGELYITDGQYRLWTTKLGVPTKFFALTGDADVPADPFETHNLHPALTAQQLARRVELLAELNAWRALG